jgi:uncharacterized protein YndB with AHSA1/START domain
VISDKFSKSSDNVILTSRSFAYPIELVFKAWSNSDHLKNWWGPNGFTNTFHEFDFRPGGKWVFTMHGPEKGNYQNECEFLEIIEPCLIAWKRYSQPLFNVVFNFDRVSDNETKVFFRMIFSTPEECNKLKQYVVDKNEENFDRLEKELPNIVLQ